MFGRQINISHAGTDTTHSHTHTHKMPFSSFLACMNIPTHTHISHAHDMSSIVYIVLDRECSVYLSLCLQSVKIVHYFCSRCTPFLFHVLDMPAVSTMDFSISSIVVGSSLPLVSGRYVTRKAATRHITPNKAPGPHINLRL